MLCLYCQKPLGLYADPRQRYCDKTCSDKKRADAKRIKPWAMNCERCSKEFSTNRKHQRFCSYACHYEYALEQANLKHKAFREANPIPESFEYNCSVCNVLIVKPHRLTGVSIKYGVYCDTCRVAAQRARYRKKTVARQSSAKPSGLWFEQILATYGSNCYLCQQDIDLSLPRTSKRGATVDHITPLSRGGQDELDNLRLVHWDCNRAKSNKLVEELNG